MGADESLVEGQAAVVAQRKTDRGVEERSLDAGVPPDVVEVEPLAAADERGRIDAVVVEVTQRAGFEDRRLGDGEELTGAEVELHVGDLRPVLVIAGREVHAVLVTTEVECDREGSVASQPGALARRGEEQPFLLPLHEGASSLRTRIVHS